MPPRAAAVIGVACCAGVPALAAVLGGLTVAAVLGVAGGILAVAALVATVLFVVGARRQRARPPDQEDDAVTIELLYFDGCPNHESFLPHLRGLLARADIPARIELRRVESVEDAESERFLGSPTVRVDGRDVDPRAHQRDAR